MNTPTNILAQVRRDMEKHLDALRKPSSEGVRNQRRQLVCEMYAHIERMEAAIRERKEGGV